MSRKAIVWVSWSIVALSLAWVGYIIGVYRGRSYQIQKETRRDALRMYKFLKQGDAIGAQEDGILSEHQLSHVSELDTTYGKVLDAKIKSVYTTPMGLPVIVELIVKREKGENREYVIRHGGDGNGLNVTGPTERPYR